MINFKISNGATPKAGKSLCVTCKHASVIKGQNCEELIFCGGDMWPHGKPVPFRVAECGSYHPMNVPWLHEMEQMAWKVEARKRDKPGFAGAMPDETEQSMEVTINPPTKRRYSWQESEDE